MELEQALQDLGVKAPLSDNVIRRAYLRGVKAHPPETDPDGFRKVRDAYDFLKDSPWRWPGTDAVGGEPASADDTALPKAMTRNQPPEATPRNQPPEPAPRNQPRRERPTLELAETEPGVAVSEQLAPPLTFPSDERPVDVVAVIRDPIESDEPESDPELESDPGADTESSGVADASCDFTGFGSSDRQLQLNDLLGVSDFEAAARLFSEWMQDPWNAGELSPWQVLNTVLSMFHHGDPKLGADLLTRFDAWSAAHGGLPSQLGAAFAARWTVLDELRALQGFVGSEVTAALAEAIESENYASAVPALERARTWHGGLARIMSRRAPVLFAAVSPKLKPPIYAKAFVRIPLMLMVLMLVRMCGQWIDGSAEQRKTTSQAVASQAPAATPAPELSPKLPELP